MNGVDEPPFAQNRERARQMRGVVADCAEVVLRHHQVTGPAARALVHR
ncbi:hypothetical protein ABZ137_05490 [Streptomyces bobili]